MKVKVTGGVKMLKTESPLRELLKYLSFRGKTKKLLALTLMIGMVLSMTAGYMPAYAEETTHTEEITGETAFNEETTDTEETSYMEETSYAEEMSLTDNGGYCEHHQAHTDACGYAEAVEGQACTHVHDENCGYVEAAGEIPCDMDCVDLDGDGVIDHAEECAYAPAVEGQECTHVHDEDCGYVEAVEGSPCSYAENGCPWCIVSWSWVDEMAVLTEVDGVWGLGLPGVSQDNLLTQENLAELLPVQISAVADNGDSLLLDITWDLSSIPEEGIYSGDYTLTAALTDSDYSLTADAAELSITLQLGGAEVYTELPSELKFPDNIVNGVSPNGTVINLFDYWITSQTAADNSNGSGFGFINSGINKDHTLLFGKGLNGADYKNGNNYVLGQWNVWTGNASPYTGIVQNELVDGYPKLNNINTDVWYLHSDFKNRDGKESLAYLFDPDMNVDGKASYEDVKGLLQVDSNGYYYYNSQENYAVYYQNTNSFALYDSPGVLKGGNSPNGQFFPFNAATSEPKNGYMNNSPSTDKSINHYFGLTMSTRFIQQYGGYTDDDDNKKKPVTYEFSGDDDVWIFIDGTLVADLGGNHNASSVVINFATGVISINGTAQSQTLGEILGTGTNTLPDNTYHTLDFFYLERGNVDSNMKLKYNLVTIPESSLIKIDQIGDPVAGAVFALYAATNPDESIATGTTDRNGEFVFLDENDYPITIQQLYDLYGDKKDDNGNNLILRETSTPSGYRTNGDIGLYFWRAEKTNEVLILSNSIWDRGAYAMSKVTTTTPNVIRLLDGNGSLNRTITLVGENPVDSPLMFAVVFQKQGDEWCPVYGDPINGWTVADNGSWNNVLEAATNNPYIFQLASSGAYQVEISNLPGDVKKYYHFVLNEENEEYSVGYFYTEAATINDATQNNTWRIDADPSGNYSNYALERVFSIDLYVSNIKNYLLVQKVDDTGTTVNGAVFSLYEAKDVTVNGDAVTVNEGAVAYDTLTTADITGLLEMKGGGIFPTDGKIIANGEYYLFESSTPDGYRLNDTAVHIVVDNTGVYADAGTANDGVSVLRGVGSIMKSMVQFAADDKVDTTLNGIKAAAASSVSFNEYQKDGSFTVSGEGIDWDGDNILHLQYANDNGLLDYGLYDKKNEGTLDTLTICTEEGWSKLLIRQCYQHDENTDITTKQDLEDADITNLFSGTVTVRVANDRTGNLSISKTVTGENAPEGQTFQFTVTLTDNGTPVTGTYDTVDEDDRTGSITFNSGGIAGLSLEDGQKITILDLPAGAVYTVEESIQPGYEASVTVTGDNTSQVDADNPARVTGTIPHNTTADEAAAVSYTNAFDGDARIILIGTKTLMGRMLSANEQYSFNLTAGDEPTKKAIEDGAILLPENTTATATGDGTAAAADFAFGQITFKAEGIYTFHITEQLPLGATEENPVSGGIRYDRHTAVVTVTVTKAADSNILTAEATYDNAGAPFEADENETEKAAFTNIYESLIISKTVTGDTGDRDAVFAFQITLKDADGNELTGSYDYMGGVVAGIDGAVSPEDGSLTLENGTASFGLKHGQRITIIGLPADCQYEITEPDAEKNGYTTSVVITVGNAAGTEETSYTASGNVTLTDTTTVAFENARSQVPVTGVMLSKLPWIMAIGIILISGLVLFLTEIYSRRRTTRRRGGNGGGGRKHGR